MFRHLARQMSRMSSPVREAVHDLLDAVAHDSWEWSRLPSVLARTTVGFLVLSVAIAMLISACSRLDFVQESQTAVAGPSERMGSIETESAAGKEPLGMPGPDHAELVGSAATAPDVTLLSPTAAATTTPAPPTSTIATPPPKAVVSRGTDTGTSLPAATRPVTGTVRVLMYHYIRDNVPATDQTGRNLSVSPADFEAQMGFISERGFVTVSLDDVVRAHAEGAALPPKAIVLTFDDGYADFYISARPVLQRHDLRATVYVISGFVGRPAYLSWPQIRELADAGFEIGSHSVNHPRLTGLTDQLLMQELSASRQQIEAFLGKPVSHFCYPSGAYDQRVRSAVAAAGYLTAVTTQSGTATPASDLLALPRLRIPGGMTLRQFAAVLGEPPPGS